MSDIEIANSTSKLDIREIGKKIGLEEEQLIMYGMDKAKIKNINYKMNGNLILVTAISPTPYGEGKTTVSIGLADALSKINKKSVVVLREPSMGPVFGMKGGATGGGYSQVIPMDDINLHFTGDFHAITAANNLLCAAIDNHIYFGNELDIQQVLINRCLDVNDRALRKVGLGYREEEFSITAASEIMALFCLADSLDDLKRRLGDIVVGYNSKRDFIYARDLKVEGAMLSLLKDAFLPNLVQTLEGTPAIIHGGPFANIAHGCNSVIGTKTGLSLCDYVVTEAGFGADLGAEKFFDIKSRILGIYPNTVVLVATIKALKYHGGLDKKNIFEQNEIALHRGLTNLERHVENIRKYGSNVIVCLNKYDTDIDSEISIVREYCEFLRVPFSICTAYLDGGEGALDLASNIVELCKLGTMSHSLYTLDLSIKEKISKIAIEIYRAKDVLYSDQALKKIQQLEEKNLFHLPICVSKTQYSFSDDAKKIGAPDDFSIYVRDINLYNGASFITILLGSITVMPGLPKVPNYEKINLVNDLIAGID